MNRFGWVTIGAVLLLAVLLRQDLLLTMGLILFLLGAAASLWTRYSLAEVTYRRHFENTRLFFGEETEMLVEVTNAKPLPLAWLRCEDEMPDALAIEPDVRLARFQPGRRLLVNIFSLRWYERVQRRYRVTGSVRGAWRFGPTNLIAGDIFGFSMQRQQVEVVDEVLVYPQLYPLTALNMPAANPFGELTSRQRLAEDPLRLLSVRDYQDGDSYRHVHWKATARRQTLQTKVFEPTSARPLAIFLNIRTYISRLAGTQPHVREFGISVAGSVARWGWEQGDPVGLFSNALIPGGRRARLAPSTHPDQAVRILEVLARLMSTPHTSIERLIEDEMRRLRYGTTIVVITAVIQPELEVLLAEAARRRFAVALIGIGDARLERAIRGVQFYYAGDGKSREEVGALELA